MIRSSSGRLSSLALVLSLIAPCAWTQQLSDAETAAITISANIQARHLPFGTILDPVYASPESDEIIAYTHCGDSALWTGVYLAAESFRYQVTKSPDALANARTALAGLQALTDITGNNRLSRCLAPADSPFAGTIENEEAHNSLIASGTSFWVGNTSRDQVVGAFFGLAAAFDLIDDPAVKTDAKWLATRLIDFISHHQWSPGDDITTTFELRPEALQMLLQVARHVNPVNGVHGPFFVPPVATGVAVDVHDDGSYFKFNLDYMSLYNLVRLQNNGSNRRAYRILRDHTKAHQNAFFDAVDRALNGADAARDAELNSLLAQWRQRPLRASFVDLTNDVAVCGDQACQPVPVALRPPSDYIWQRSPFQLSGGEAWTVESAGIDYILPYWMGRYYGVDVDGPIPAPSQ